MQSEILTMTFTAPLYIFSAHLEVIPSPKIEQKVELQ